MQPVHAMDRSTMTRNQVYNLLLHTVPILIRDYDQLMIHGIVQELSKLFDKDVYTERRKRALATYRTELAVTGDQKQKLFFISKSLERTKKELIRQREEVDILENNIHKLQVAFEAATSKVRLYNLVL